MLAGRGRAHHTVDHQDVAIPDACLYQCVPFCANYEGRLWMQEEGFVQIDAFDGDVAARRAEAGRCSAIPRKRGGAACLSLRRKPGRHETRRTQRERLGSPLHRKTARRERRELAASASTRPGQAAVSRRQYLDRWDCHRSGAPAHLMVSCLGVRARQATATSAAFGARCSLQPHAAPWVPLGRPHCADFASQAFTPGCSPTARYRRRSFGQ